MNEAACVVYVALFLVMPPALLFTRWLDPVRMPWVLLLGVSMIGGWLLANLAQMFYANGMEVRMMMAGDRLHWQGLAPRYDGLFKFGWLLGPVYLLPWWGLYCACLFMRWMLSSPREFRRR